MDWSGIACHTVTLVSALCVNRTWVARKDGYSDEFQKFADGLEPKKYSVD